MIKQLNKKTLFADLSLLIVALIWGGGFIAAKLALAHITPLYLLTFRFLGSGFILSMVFIRKTTSFDRRGLLSGIVLGSLLFVGYTLQTIGLKYTTASKQSFIVATYSILVPFFSWTFNKKRPTTNSFIAGVLTLIGVAFLTLDSNFTISVGDGLSLLFAIVFATQIVLVGIYAKDIDPFTLTTTQMITAGVLTFVCALIFDSPPSYLGQRTIMAVVYLVLFNTLIAFLIQSIAQRYTTDTHASVILSLQSLFGCILAVLVIGEAFTLKLFIGSMLIMTSVIISELSGTSFDITNLLKLKKLRANG